jgi:hypothetical protein
MKRVWYTAAACGMAMLFAGNANAVTTTTTYLISNTNTCNGGCTTGPFGTVTDVVDTTAVTSTITVSLASPYEFVGGANVFGFDLVGSPTIIFTNVGNGGSTGSFSATTPQTAGSTTLDGFGKFEYTLDAAGNGGSSPQGNELVFTINTTAALVSNSATSTTNFLFALDLCPSTGCGQGLTGFAGGGPTCTFNCSSQNETPLPATLPLLASVLGGGFAFSKWRKRRRAVGSNRQAVAA